MVTIKITEEILPHIEKALNIELYDQQKKYLLAYGKYSITGGRGVGRTLVHSIVLALSDGEELDMRKPEEFSDYGDGTIRYARQHYRSFFLKVWYSLKDYGFPVRKLRL